MVKIRAHLLGQRYIWPAATLPALIKEMLSIHGVTRDTILKANNYVHAMSALTGVDVRRP